MSTIDAGRRERRRLLRQVLIPVILLIVVGAVCNLLMTMRAGAELDRDAAHAERQMVTAVSKRLLERLHQFVADYSYWDEFFVQAQGGISGAWAEQNLGPYMSNAFGISQTWVVGADGAEYAWSVGGGAEAQFRETPRLHRLVDVARAQPLRVGSAPVSGYVMLEGRAYLAAAAALKPVDALLGADTGVPKVFLVLAPLTDEAYRQLSEDFGLEGITFVQDTPERGLTRTALVDIDGQTIGFFVWKPSSHALSFLNRYWPTSLSVMLFLIAILAVLTMRWKRMIETMQLASRTATAAARESRAKSVFIANMSHELRTPLNAIIGFSELMASETFGPHAEPRYKEYSGDILASGRHLLATINDVLAVAKIEAGQYRFDVEDCPVDEAVEDIHRQLLPEAERRGISLKIAPGPCDLQVRADAKAIRQILTNIVSNGLKFTERGGEVVIAWAAHQDSWRTQIEIRDNGIGIPPDKIQALCTPFYQVSDLLTRNEGGMGLGLSIVQGMMSAMDGRIEIASEVGQGTTVRIILPSASQERAVALAS